MISLVKSPPGIMIGPLISRIASLISPCEALGCFRVMFQLMTSASATLDKLGSYMYSIGLSTNTQDHDEARQAVGFIGATVGHIDYSSPRSRSFPQRMVRYLSPSMLRTLVTNTEMAGN